MPENSDSQDQKKDDRLSRRRFLKRSGAAAMATVVVTTYETNQAEAGLIDGLRWVGSKLKQVGSGILKLLRKLFGSTHIHNWVEIQGTNRMRCTKCGAVWEPDPNDPGPQFPPQAGFTF